jgi:enamine deaminase RidA (YjgF/YER057c/UK114 family)
MPAEFLNPPTLSRPTAYAHVAVVEGRQIHVSGQVALDASGVLVGKGDLETQTEQVYRNLAGALGAAGANFKHVFKATTYVVDLTKERAATVRRVRQRHFGEGPYPTSTMVGVDALVDPDFLIEIEVIASLS